MSYAQLIIFKEGKANGGVEYRNAWGGSARIWDALFNSYVPKKHEYDSWLAHGGVTNHRSNNGNSAQSPVTPAGRGLPEGSAGE